MSGRRDLCCPNRCVGALFEAVNAPLVVDAQGAYIGHDDSAATFICAACGSVSVDLSAVAREMRRGDGGQAVATLTCPACGVMMLPPEDDPLASRVECPACGLTFAIDDGMPHLHGSTDFAD